MAPAEFTESREPPWILPSQVEPSHNKTVFTMRAHRHVSTTEYKPQAGRQIGSRAEGNSYPEDS